MLSKGNKSVRIGRLKLPGDFMQIKESDQCQRLANSIQRIGLIVPPLLNQENYVICGRTRVAACALLAWESVECRVVECGEAEMAIIRDNYKLCRQHLTMGQQADLALAARDRVFEAALQSDPKALKADADAVAAELTGVTARTLSNRKSRPPRKGEREKIRNTEDIDFAWFESFGLKLPPELLERMVQVETGIRTAIRNAVHTRNETLLLKRSHAIPQSEVAVLLAASDASLTRLGQSRVWGLCPRCKGAAGLQATCATCEGRGHITVAQSANIPRELLRKDVLFVAVNGVIKPADSYLNPSAFVADEDGVF